MGGKSFLRNKSMQYLERTKAGSFDSAFFVSVETNFLKSMVTGSGKRCGLQLMLFAYPHLAARRSELFRLKWGDVDFANCRVRIGMRKGAGGNMEFDLLPMSEELFKVLFKYRQKAKTEWVFPEPETGQAFISRQHLMSRFCKRAKVKRFGPHALRHLTASILA
jgi:integrase